MIYKKNLLIEKKFQIFFYINKTYKVSILDGTKQITVLGLISCYHKCSMSLWTKSPQMFFLSFEYPKSIHKNVQKCPKIGENWHFFCYHKFSTWIFQNFSFFTLTSHKIAKKIVFYFISPEMKNGHFKCPLLLLQT